VSTEPSTGDLTGEPSTIHPVDEQNPQRIDELVGRLTLCPPPGMSTWPADVARRWPWKPVAKVSMSSWDRPSICIAHRWAEDISKRSAKTLCSPPIWPRPTSPECRVMVLAPP